MQVRGKIVFHKYLINIQVLRFNGSKTGPVESSDSALTQRALRSLMRGVRQPATQVAPWATSRRPYPGMVRTERALHDPSVCNPHYCQPSASGRLVPALVKAAREPLPPDATRSDQGVFSADTQQRRRCAPGTACKPLRRKPARSELDDTQRAFHGLKFEITFL